MPAYVDKYMDFYAVVYNAISETTQNYNYMSQLEVRRKLLSPSVIASKSKNIFQNDLCLACLGPHYSTNTAIIAPKLL